MNRRERRKLQKQGVQVPKDPSINIKLSDMSFSLHSCNSSMLQ